MAVVLRLQRHALHGPPCKTIHPVRADEDISSVHGAVSARHSDSVGADAAAIVSERVALAVVVVVETFDIHDLLSEQDPALALVREAGVDVSEQVCSMKRERAYSVALSAVQTSAMAVS